MKIPKTSTRKYIIIAGLVIILSLVILGAFRFYQTIPSDLGHKLEYVGSEDEWCFIGCEFNFYSRTYYFATNLSKNELETYFAKAKPIMSEYEQSEDGVGIFTNETGEDLRYTYKYLSFKKLSDNHYFTLSIYNTKRALIEKANLKQTNKQNIISIEDSEYMLAKESL